MATRRPSRRPARRPTAPGSPSGHAFPIVGIGASAGGLEAFSQVLGALPTDTGAAFVLVQHLHPEHESILASLLARDTSMPVRETTDGERIEPNHVYVIPPTVDIALVDGHIQHVPRGPRRAPHLPIDLFLRTLADVHESRAIAVILSGTGTDGTEGCRDVKSRGGIAFAQDPASAKFPGMPRSAIDSQCVDFVLPPAAIAAEIGRLAGEEYVRTAGNGGSLASPSDGDDHARIFALLRRETAADFSCYRKTTLDRRIQRRMALHGIEDLPAYVRFLEERAGELEALHRDLLIHVTSFFRDPETFEFLKAEVLPRRLLARPAGQPIRVWVPACATGEEAYSIAMCLLEVQSELAGNTPIQVFASDLSDTAIQAARSGTYPESIEGQVSAQRLSRFFVKEGSRYHVSKTVRSLLVFARHDVTRDPPFSRMDLVSCRNVLIYLEAPLQKRVIGTLHYSLNPGGLLLLGQSETVGASADAFEVVDRQHKLYSKRDRAASSLFIGSPIGGAMPPGPASTVAAAPRDGRRDAVRDAERLLLRRFAPASVLIDDRDEVFHFGGDTEPYLGHPAGAASLQLTSLARRSLLPDLRALLRDARKRASPQRRTGVLLRERGRNLTVALEAIPIQAASSGDRYCLVLFEEEVKKARPAVVRSVRSPSAEKRHLAQLELEVQALEQSHQAAQQDFDVAREELQAANEEVVSSNEELQSTNEELETAKEELQSNNEELLTLNEELQTRNRELQHLHDVLRVNQQVVEAARDFAESIVDTAREPLVILDGALCVKRTNAAFSETFGVSRAEAEGAPFFDVMRQGWADDRLRGLLEDVLETGRSFEDYVIEDDSTGLRTLVLNARRFQQEPGRGDLALVAIEDRTEALRAEGERTELLHRAETAASEAEAANRLKDEFVANASHELRGPLSAMLTWTHLLSGAPTDSELIAQGLAVIERSARAQTHLIEDLLDASRMSLGKLQLEMRLHPLKPIIEAAIDGARAAAEAKGIAVAFETCMGPETVLADHERLQQVFWNLVSNSVKFTPTGGHVAVWCGRVGTFLQVKVSDDGQGISATFLPHVFERFRQGDGSTSRSQSGLGLGLAIVRQLVELHGGTAWAESAGEGRGATFVVSLPVPSIRAVDGSESGATVPGQSAGSGHLSLKGLDVLIVDDDADGREAVRGVLQMHGAAVRAVSSANEALLEFDAAPPQVLVSDIGMPGQDGYSLLRTIRGRAGDKGGGVPALALTAYAAPEDRQRSAMAGFQEYLSKPAEPAELVRCVAALAGRKTPA